MKNLFRAFASFLLLPSIFLSGLFTSCTQGEFDSSVALKLPDEMVRDVVEVSVQNGYDCQLKICVSGQGAGGSTIEKSWNLTLDSIKATSSFSIEGLLSNAPVNIDVYFLIDGQIYYQSKTTKVNLTSGNNCVDIVLNRIKEMAEVSGLTVTPSNDNAILKWTDPDDADLFGIEVTYVKSASSASDTAAESGRAILPVMEKGSLFVAPGSQSCVVTSLSSGNYIFTVKTMDVNGCKSSGLSSGEVTINVEEKSQLQINLSPSTSEATSGAVTVTVTLATTGVLKNAYYMVGIVTNADEIVSGGSALTVTENQDSGSVNSGTFAVEENGTYTVFASDYDGRREFSYITISNIDKTAPAAPVNFVAKYDCTNKKITLTWQETSSDVASYSLVWQKNSDLPINCNDQITATSYEISDVEAGSDTYNFTLKAIDKAGNVSTTVTTSIVPQTIPTISSLTLSKNHFANTEGGSSFTVNVSGFNFDLINNTDEDEKLVIQIVDESGNVTNFYDTTVDTTNNTASASLTLPTLSSATAAGKNYTVRAKVYGQVDESHVATFNISAATAVTKVNLSVATLPVTSVSTTAQDESFTTTVAYVYGTNFDLAKSIKLAIYDSQGTLYENSTVSVDKSNFTQTTEEITATLNLPTTDDIYTVKVFVDDVEQSKNATLFVYGDPSFTSFTIPNAGTVKEDNYVTASVTGKNFTNPNITDVNKTFTVSCDDATCGSAIVSGASLTVVNDRYMQVKLCIPGTAGKYTVKITCGENSTEATFTVKDYAGYSVGDIILADGSKVDVSNVANYTADENNVAVGVVAFINDYGAPVVLGLKQSESKLAWASVNTTGYYKHFTTIVGDSISGDTDGSDNWEYICSVDPVGSKDAATNYPAFNFAANYGTSENFSGSLASGWYVPAQKELYNVNMNKDVLQTSLTAASGFTFNVGSSYLSSSQNSSFYWYIQSVRLGSEAYAENKPTPMYVLVLHALPD